MCNIFFSIIVPVYNSDKYLANFLDTVLAQKYDKFEVILINDGSTDSSLDICRDYEKKDSRIRVLDKKNEGICKTRNFGIKNANYDYIVFYDNDDCVNKDYLQEAADVLSRNQCDIMIFSFLYNQLNRNGKSINVELYQHESMGLIEDNGIHEYVISSFGRTFNPVWNKVFRKKFIQDNEIFFDERYKRGMEDVSFNVKAFSVAKRIYCSNSIAYEYYIRDTQSTSRKYNPFLLKDSVRLFSQIEDAFKSPADNNSEKRLFVRQKFQYLVVAPLENEINNPNYSKGDLIKILKDASVGSFVLSINDNQVVYLNKYQKTLFRLLKRNSIHKLELFIKLKMKIRSYGKLFSFVKSLV